jgi:hypothetical protein
MAYQTYQEMIPAFQRELERLAQPVVTVSPQALLALLGHEGSREADAAVRAFAAGQSWPPVSDLCRVELCLRLSCLLWWLTEQRAENPEGDSLLQTAEQVLIEYWRDVGRVDWIHARYVKPFADEHFPGSTEHS